MYIYKTTNTINSKMYIGKSERNIHESKDYYGSGKLLKNAIKKYSKCNFKKEILYVVDDLELLDFIEELVIEKYKNKFGNNCYNIANGGSGGNNHKYKNDIEKQKFSEKMSILNAGSKNGFFSKEHSDETKQKISENKTGVAMSDNFREKCSKRMLGNEINDGRKHSDEVNKKKASHGDKNGMFGKEHSQESLDKISKNIKKSKMKKFTCEFCNKLSDKGNYNRWHGKNCKMNPNLTQEQKDKRIPWNKKGSTTSS